MKRDSVNQRHLASFSVVECHVVTTDVALQGEFSTQKHTNVRILRPNHTKKQN